MVDGVEKLGQVDVHGITVAVLYVASYPPDSLVRIAAWSEPIA
jgi:hypothetical protein